MTITNKIIFILKHSNFPNYTKRKDEITDFLRFAIDPYKERTEQYITSVYSTGFGYTNLGVFLITDQRLIEIYIRFDHTIKDFITKEEKPVKGKCSAVSSYWKTGRKITVEQWGEYGPNDLSPSIKIELLDNIELDWNRGTIDTCESLDFKNRILEKMDEHDLLMLQKN